MTLAILDTNYQHALAWYRAFHKHGLSDATSDARMAV
jgi:hypothetical protein